MDNQKKNITEQEEQDIQVLNMLDKYKQFLKDASKIMPVLEDIKYTDAGREFLECDAESFDSYVMGRFLIACNQMVSVAQIKNKWPKWKSLELEDLLKALTAFLNFQGMAKQLIEGEPQFFSALITILVDYIAHRLPESVYLIPMVYEDDIYGDPVDDDIIHISMSAAEYIANKGVDVHTPVVFVGKNYRFATDRDVKDLQENKKMQLQIAQSNGKTFIPLFTNFHYLFKVFGKNVRIGLFTYEDVLNRLDDEIINNPVQGKRIDGIVINPATNDYILTKEQFKKLGENENEKENDDSKAETDIEQEKIEKQSSIDIPEQKKTETQEKYIFNKYKDIKIIRPEGSQWCKASQVMGILAFFTDFTPVLGIVAVVLGMIGKSKIDSNDKKSYRKAKIGVITGVINILLGIFIIATIIYDTQ